MVLLPEGFLIGGVGAGAAFDREPLVRTAARCLASSSTPPPSHLDFSEHVFVGHDELVVIVRGRRHVRLALALACTREPNLAWVVSTARGALQRIEASTDFSAWEL